MLGRECLLFSVTSNNLICSFVYTYFHTPLMATRGCSTAPRLWWQRPTLRQRSATGMCSDCP